MSENKVTLNQEELNTICEVVKDVGCTSWRLIQDSSSGIGRSTWIEYDTRKAGYDATVRINITDVSRW
jgi:hypothetical protein